MNCCYKTVLNAAIQSSISFNRLTIRETRRKILDHIGIRLFYDKLNLVYISKHLFKQDVEISTGFILFVKLTANGNWVGESERFICEIHSFQKETNKSL